MSSLSRSKQDVFVLCATVLTLLTFIVSSIAQTQKSTDLIEQAIRHQNLGLAYLEESQPSKAVEVFGSLVELLPDEAIGYGNLAVAHLRLQQATAAESAVKRGILVAPMNSQLHFILSEIYQLQGKSTEAIEAMTEAVRLAPEELEFRYKLARHYLGQRNNPDALQNAVQHLKVLHTLSPANIVILLKLTQALLARPDVTLPEVKDLCMELNALLWDTDPEKLKYLTNGIAMIEQADIKTAARNIRIFENVHRATPRYQQGIGELVTDILGHPIETFSTGFKARFIAKQTQPIPVQFVDVTPDIGLDDVRMQTENPALFLIDYDGDGQLDLYVSPLGRLFRNDGEKFIQVQQFPADVSQPHRAAFADLDKDGIQELLLQTPSGIARLEQTEEGNWIAAEIVQYANEDKADAPNLLLPVDYDHDGDLDLFSSRTSVEMYRNNADGTFIDVTEQTFLTANRISQDEYGATDAQFADFDDDGDIDIFVIHNETGCTLWDNLRQGRLRALSDETGIPQEPRYTALATADYDNDRNVDLFLTTQSGSHLYRNRGDGSFVPDTRSQILNNISGRDAHFFDYDNDGFLDLWVLAEDKLYLFRNDGTGQFTAPSDLLAGYAGGVTGTVGDADNDGDIEIFFINTGGQLRSLQNRGGNLNNWIQVKLEGITAGNNKINRDALGSKLEVKVGDLYQLQYVSQPVSHFGIGTFDKADVVRVVWTNGVPQNVITPKAKQRILEKQILKGSCPFLYVYDGERYQFATDLLWRAPLGLITSMGFVAPDETKDFVKIPGARIQPKSGKYTLQITEELWETAYFDIVKLIAVDHPVGTDIFVNEQYTPPPFAEFTVYGVAEKRHPKAAFTHQGEEVSEALRTFDYRYPVEHAPGIHQGVVKPHAIILDLGDVPNDMPLTLFLTGWIFPTDTSINVSLFQNPSISPRFPSIAVKNEAGEWQTVIDMIGLPAGKNKTITVDLTGKFLSNDRHVRIETDLQIYWDAAFFTLGQQNVPMQITELNPDSANLHYRGFSEMYRPTPHAPHLFDYDKVTTAAQWRDLEGYYTRYGDVTPLLQEIDDMYVILNAGDEITVQFDEMHLPRLKTGWTRDFILFSDGWDKDGDINTLTSQTVEPLPFHGMSVYPYPETERYPDDVEHRRYRLEYNTRRVMHRLPLLQKIQKSE